MSRDRNRGNGGSSAPAAATKQKGDRPHYVYRLGVLKLSCWLNEGDNGKWFSCKLVRLYKDGENWKDSPSLNDTDLCTAAAMLLHAHHELGMERGGDEKFGDENPPSGGDSGGGSNGGGQR